MDLEPERMGKRRALRAARASSASRLSNSPGVVEIAIGAGMQLDHRRADPRRRLDLRRLVADEQRHAAARPRAAAR